MLGRQFLQRFVQFFLELADIGVALGAAVVGQSGNDFL